jgi:hypothetical protein
MPYINAENDRKRGKELKGEKVLKHKIEKCEFRGFSKSIMFEIKSDSMI